MWQLLIWAYRKQMVQYETDRHREWRPGSFADELLGFGRGSSPRATINGAGSSAHDDAHIVHAHVMRLRPKAGDLIVAHAARGSPPDWNPRLPPCRIVPMRRGGGAIRMLWRRGNAVGCLIDYEGIPEGEAERIRQRARDAYTDWWQALRQVRLTMVHEHRLTLWRVSGLGADDEPWRAALDKIRFCENAQAQL
jgi:hypothetical protein